LYLDQYQPITPNEQRWLWSEVLGLYLGVYEQQLRYFSIEGTLLPTAQEAIQAEVAKGLGIYQQEKLRAEQAQQDAEQERLRAAQAQSELQALQEKIRSLGIEID